ncbi:hypothetical protein D3C81_2308410 [compost metagenome]
MAAATAATKATTPRTINRTGLAISAPLVSQIAACHSSIAPRTRPIQATIAISPTVKAVIMTT